MQGRWEKGYKHQKGDINFSLGILVASFSGGHFLWRFLHTLLD